MIAVLALVPERLIAIGDRKVHNEKNFVLVKNDGKGIAKHRGNFTVTQHFFHASRHMVLTVAVTVLTGSNRQVRERFFGHGKRDKRRVGWFWRCYRDAIASLKNEITVA